jgi:hypothetical protein
MPQHVLSRIDSVCGHVIFAKEFPLHFSRHFSPTRLRFGQPRVLRFFSPQRERDEHHAPPFVPCPSFSCISIRRCTIALSACEGCMLHKGQESSSRRLTWVDRLTFKGWGCSECDWRFYPSGPPMGESLEEMKRNFEMQLSEEFASHGCAKHPRAKGPRFSS